MSSRNAGRGKPDIQNRKPYRTKAQKQLARETAVKCKDGTFRSNAPVSYHPAPRGART